MRRAVRCGWVRLGLAAMVCGLTAVGAPLAAADPSAWATGTEAVLPANAAFPFSGVDLTSISCGSVGDCSAVGNYSDGSNNRQGLLLGEISGVWGTGIEPTPPANAMSGLRGQPDAVSCPAAGDCTAVGTYTDNMSQGQGLLLTETNGVWGTGEEASLPANALPISVILSSVSCPSVGNCAAVGEYYKTGQQQVGLLLTESGGVWSMGREAPLPVDASTSAQGVQLWSVSCASVGECSAVGFYKDSMGAQQGLLLTLANDTWTPAEVTLPADDSLTSHRVVVTSVSCGAAGDCGAVGEDTDTSGHQVGLLLTQSGGTWEQAVKPVLPPGAGLGSSGVPRSVSCAAGGNCSAVGNYVDSNGESQGLLLTESGGTWEQGAGAALPANASATDPAAQLTSISCVSASNCSAVGQYTDNTGNPLGYNTQGLLLSESSGLWGTGVEAVLPSNADSAPLAAVTFVSCAVAGNCSAVGGYNDSSGNPHGLLLGGSGPKFTLGVSRKGSGAGHVTGSGISCPSTCSRRYPAGTVVTLAATPASGSAFAGWSGGGCTGTSTCKVTLNADRAVTATFAGPPKQTLTIARTGSGAGTVTSSPAGIGCGTVCSAQFDRGTQVTLVPRPASGSLFAGWSGGGCGQARAEKPQAGGPGSGCQVTMSSDQTVSANFVPRAEVAANRQQLAADLEKLRQAIHGPASVGKALCTGHAKYVVGAKQAEQFKADPITLAKAAGNPARDHGAASRPVVVFASATHRFRHAGKATIIQRLTRAGRQILQRAEHQHRDLRLHVELSFTFADPVKVNREGTVLTKPPPPAARC